MDNDDTEPMDGRRVFAFVLLALGLFTILASIVTFLMKMHILVFIIVMVLGLVWLFIALYILVRTKPEPPKNEEEFDVEHPDTTKDFDEWAKEASTNTYKSERPDPSQYKPKKQYKAFPGAGKSEEKKEDEAG